MERAAYLDRARNRGVNPLVYWVVRALFQPFFHLYFRMSRVGREHVPQDGPMIIAANHRSFLDPFVIGTLVRRPIYFVAKKELFRKPLVAWFLNSLGAFPIDRGNADGDAMATAREILERGDVVVIFPEGTRVRPGALGRPKRGVGRLALETGAPVLPVAVIGTEAIRRGWRIRPHKVRIRCGSPLTFPKVENPSPELARAVTDRIWPCVALQWEWLGGLAPVRRAAVVGDDPWGAALAVSLERAGVDVSRVAPTAEAELGAQDLVCLAVPGRDLPAAMAVHGHRIPQRAGVLVVSRGLVPDTQTLPAAYVREHCRARAVATLASPAGAARALDAGASLVVASEDRGFARQVADLLRTAGLDLAQTTDVAGVDLAGAAFAAQRSQPASAETLARIAALAAELRAGGADAPATAALDEVVHGRLEPEHWVERVSSAAPSRSRVA
ncbi:MAG TPA: 1-acylglycerol-3-phosphate O-acyltransferase [Capillimicrobium sp.]|nr:1-acylglycerol-3-phosphate O-acyltransferase [Capillimicrobium sp.]